MTITEYQNVTKLILRSTSDWDQCSTVQYSAVQYSISASDWDQCLFLRFTTQTYEIYINWLYVTHLIKM